MRCVNNRDRAPTRDVRVVNGAQHVIQRERARGLAPRGGTELLSQDQDGFSRAGDRICQDSNREFLIDRAIVCLLP